jgi:hypothetical protein
VRARKVNFQAGWARDFGFNQKLMANDAEAGAEFKGVRFQGGTRS